MKRSLLLGIDASVNLALGVLLLLFPPAVVEFLGIPPSDARFYPSLLGAVLVGIGVALGQEARNPSSRDTTGLGLLGAVTINLCGGLVLGVWLVGGSLDLPLRGVLFLWLLVAFLVGISAIELVAVARQGTRRELSN